MAHATSTSSSTGRGNSPDRHRGLSPYLGGAAALILFLVFLIGGTGIVSSITEAPGLEGWFAPLQRNWLVILFQVNVPSSGTQADSLTTLSPLDLAIMVVFAVMSLSIYAVLRRIAGLWSLIAASLPILGIPVFVMTATAGRSALLLSGLIVSAVMLRSDCFGRACAYTGIAASALLFFGGDIATAIFSPSAPIAALIGIGYLLWLIWLLLLSLRLFQLGSFRREALQQRLPGSANSG